MDMDKLFKAMVEDSYNDWRNILEHKQVTKKLLTMLGNIENLSGQNLRQARYFISKDVANDDAIEVAASYTFASNTLDFILGSFRLGLTKEQVKVFALPKFSLYQMQVIRSGFSEGLSIEQVKTFARPEIPCDKMKKIRDELVRDTKTAHLRELFQKIPAN